MTDHSHLNALRTGLSNERSRLALATNAKEIALRTVWVAQIEKEIAGELEFLGITDEPIEGYSDDELLALLQD